MSKLLAVTLLFVSLLAAHAKATDADRCSALFVDATETSPSVSEYIRETAEGSKLRAFGQAVFTGATALQFGMPAILRGLKLPRIFWTRDGHMLQGTSRAYGEGSSEWGAISIFSSSKYIQITIEPNIGDLPLTNKQLMILQELYPALTIVKNGRSGLSSGDGPVPKEYNLSFDRSAMPDQESFVATVRSLVNTLLNDPKGVLHP
jgi:hypothetical protein